MKIARTEHVRLEPGVYEAVVADVEPEVGTFGDQLKWKLLLLDADGQEAELWAWCSQKFSPMAKLWGWVDAIMFGGRGVPATYQEFDTSDVIGRSCLVTVALKAGDRGDYNRVEAILPSRQEGANIPNVLMPVPDTEPAPAPIVAIEGVDASEIPF